MYNPKEFKFCFHVDMQQVHIKPCKISSKELVCGFRRAVASRAIFSSSDHKLAQALKFLRSLNKTAQFRKPKKSRMGYKI